MSQDNFEALLGFTPLKAQLLRDLGIDRSNCLDDSPVNKPRETNSDFYNEYDVIENKDFLTYTQTAAVIYKDIYKLIPNRKIRFIEEIIAQELKNLDGKFKFTICGEYRRQLKWCKDINIVITHEDETNFTDRPLRLECVAKQLMKIGFIVEIIEGVNKKGTCSAICQLGISSNFNLINFLYVPPFKYYMAVFMETGPKLFVDKVIKHAGNLGMKIEKNEIQKVFCRDLIREPPLKIANEEDVFDVLCLPYKNPQDRH
ncbi:unnamed protein product [Brassicogethes aeneus]|uniref:DNA polymerase n=1 Tax=Brassicogethes aeneus TaxID=1431903 RepID=A0A9P0FLW5_BRAAE|nr:unnamed protein product [Brassicogethes aeneus]